MINSDDFPCFVSIYTQEKCDPIKDGLKVDEMRYFTSMSAYLDWLNDLDSEPEPWEE